MQTFIHEYAQNKEEWKALWKGNTDLFNPFKDVIDEYYTQWLTAENVTALAEYFDILGVFQQILNLLINVIEAHFQPNNKERIYERIEHMFENYLSHDYVKQHPELCKFSFNRATGINIISIDPKNVDMIIVEKQIVNLIRRVVEMIKSEVGYQKSLKFFIDENIFEYLVSNLSLLNELNLFKFLLKLFLLNK
jgi:hypothetical protein